MSFDELFDYAQASSGKTPSALPISVGLVSNFADVYYFIGFLQGFLNKGANALPAVEMQPSDNMLIRDTA